MPRLSMILTGLLLLGCVVGCSGARPATVEERAALGEALATYENAERAASRPTTGPATTPSNYLVRRITIEKARVAPREALCEYRVYDPRGQLAEGWPFKATLTREEGTWKVVRRESNQTLLFNLLNQTVGVK